MALVVVHVGALMSRSAYILPSGCNFPVLGSLRLCDNIAFPDLLLGAKLRFKWMERWKSGSAILEGFMNSGCSYSISCTLNPKKILAVVEINPEIDTLFIFTVLLYHFLT